jgi:6-phosphogluconolactonase
VWVYVGTYEPGDREALFVLRLDPSTGRLTLEGAASGVGHPSFLVPHPDGKRLYGVSERPDGAGEVVVWDRDPATGRLALRSRHPAGSGPCHLALDPLGRCLLVAHYAGGTVAAYDLAPDGEPAGAPRVLRHEGRGPHPRQEAAHPHGVHPDPEGRFVYVPDLGLDEVRVYRLPSLEPVAAARTRPASGPRHLALHPSRPLAYLVGELDATVTAYRRDPATGALVALGTASAAAASADGARTGAEVAVHPAGHAVYASVRGDDHLAVFAVRPDGTLEPRAHVPAGGRIPRHFALDPTGRWLLVAHQGSGTVACFRVDPATGDLEPTGQRIAVPHPVCVAFAP